MSSPALLLGNVPVRAWSPSAAAARFRGSPWYVGLALAGSYSLTYFWRYPIFVLPLSTLHQPCATIGGTQLDVQQGYTLAMTLGFGLAKPPAMRAMTSAAFFRHRCAYLVALYWASMLIECVGIAVLDQPIAQVGCVFASSFLSSWIFGGLVTYLEGRQTTEGLLAIVTFSYIWAGNLSRGAGAIALEWGVPDRLMPLAVGLVACGGASGLLVVAANAPHANASPRDVAARCARRGMTPHEGFAFFARWFGGMAGLVLAYVLLASVRTYRDLYSADLFAEALGSPVPSVVFFLVDAPGAVLACAVMWCCGHVADHRRALTALISAQLVFAGVLVGSTVLYDAGVLGGLVWQVLVGVGIYGVYALASTPCFDRLLALSRTPMTCAFLVFFADMCAYGGAITLQLVQMFGPKSAAGVKHVFVLAVYAGGGGTLCALVLALVYFRARTRAKAKPLCELEAEPLEPLSLH